MNASFTVFFWAQAVAGWRARPAPCAAPMSAARRALAESRGFIFDLDGCVWTGDVLVPGAAELLALLRSQGRGVCFLTNNSRARAQTLQAKLERLGVQASTHEVLT